ncbi:hypothetical protein QBC38DRAFT_523503 [Podospora fimiseda]|uniref:Uncharacterized protein n=1 Tax=Podospora fimiseda TaxID=252190 RepID=A0AAN7H5R4_9PEZI|nr:hypothetical protein QBC38DRAFT_523503 [Podospora fimiseda]
MSSQDNLEAFGALRSAILVNRQLSQEVASLFYGKNIFQLEPGHLKLWIHRIGANAKSVRSIVISPKNRTEEFPTWHRRYEQDRGVQSHREEKDNLWRLLAQFILGGNEVANLRELTIAWTPKLCMPDESFELDHARMIAAMTPTRPSRDTTWCSNLNSLEQIVFKFFSYFPPSKLDLTSYTKACKIWELNVNLHITCFELIGEQPKPQQGRRRSSMMEPNVARAMAVAVARYFDEARWVKHIQVNIKWEEIKNLEPNEAAAQIMERVLTRLEND